MAPVSACADMTIGPTRVLKTNFPDTEKRHVLEYNLANEVKHAAVTSVVSTD